MTYFCGLSEFNDGITLGYNQNKEVTFSRGGNSQHHIQDLFTPMLFDM